MRFTNLIQRTDFETTHDLFLGDQTQQRNKRKRDLNGLKHVKPLVQDIERSFRGIKHQSNDYGRNDRAATRDQSPQPLLHLEIQKPSHDELSRVCARDGAALPSGQQPYPPDVQYREQPASVLVLQVLTRVHQADAVGEVGVVEPFGEDRCDEEVDHEGDDESDRGFDRVVVYSFLDSVLLSFVDFTGLNES